MHSAMWVKNDWRWMVGVEAFPLSFIPYLWLTVPKAQDGF